MVASARRRRFTQRVPERILGQGHHPNKPAKERETSNWLQQMIIEGTDSLGDLYHAPADELKKIKAELIAANVTAEAIKYLCAQVALKHKESLNGLAAAVVPKPTVRGTIAP